MRLRNSRAGQPRTEANDVTRKTLVLGAFATIVAVLLAIIGFRQDARIVETSAQTIRTEAPRDAVVSQKEQSSEIAEKRRLDAAVQRATLGAKTLKNATNNPDSFKLESALVIDDTGAVCYDFPGRSRSWFRPSMEYRMCRQKRLGCFGRHSLVRFLALFLYRLIHTCIDKIHACMYSASQDTPPAPRRLGDAKQPVTALS